MKVDENLKTTLENSMGKNNELYPNTSKFYTEGEYETSTEEGTNKDIELNVHPNKYFIVIKT